MKESTTTRIVPARPVARFNDTKKSTMAERDNGHDWWAPVWKGLVLDKEARHYRQMGSAIWLFAYFILCADRQTGNLRRKAVTISRQMGVKERTVRVWLNILRQGKYVETTNSGRSLLISIQKWKTYPQWQNNDNQSDIIMSNRVTKLCPSEVTKKGRIAADVSQKSAIGQKPNDITLKTYIFKNVSGGGDKATADEENSLALAICQAFKDEDNRPLYLSYVSKYSKAIIQKAFKATIKLPAKKIKKTRGALFTYLVKFYAKEQHNQQDHRH